MEIVLKLIKGQYGLKKTFWLFWFIPSVIFNILLSPEIYIPLLIELNSTSYLLAAILSISVLAFFTLYNIILAIANWNAANLYAGPKKWSILVKLYIILVVLVFCYEAIKDFASEDEADTLATATTPLPFEGYWQTNCSDNSGILIMHAEGMKFSVQFCSGAGCSEPGKYKPNTTLINDPDYEFIDETHMNIRDHSGINKYTLCQSQQNL